MDLSPIWSAAVVLGPIALLAALIYGAFTWRRRRVPGEEARRDRKTRELYDRSADEDQPVQRPVAAPPLAPDAQARLTEDEMARERLGGSRGSPQLKEAPMVRQQGENISRSNEPGHTG